MSDELKKVADPVGERVGNFEAKDQSYFLPPLGDRSHHFTTDKVMEAVGLEPSDYCRNAVRNRLHQMTSGERYTLYRAIKKLVLESLPVAALASKPSAEGIPVKRLAVNVGIHGETMNEAPQGAYVLWSEHTAIISVKDADIAELTKKFEHNGLLAVERRFRAEDAESELAALKLSSARIEEETLRKAEKECRYIYATWAHEVLPNSAATAVGAKECWDAILSLIPTSPESQKEGE